MLAGRSLRRHMPIARGAQKMNKIILIMLAFCGGAAFGYNQNPPVMDRYVVEYHHGTETDDIGVVRLSQKDIEEIIQ